MFVLTITDTETGSKEEATVKGLRVLTGRYTPEQTKPYLPSVAMADTADLLYQVKSPSVVQSLFQAASAPRFTLDMRHI